MAKKTPKKPTRKAVTSKKASAKPKKAAKKPTVAKASKAVKKTPAKKTAKKVASSSQKSSKKKVVKKSVKKVTKKSTKKTAAPKKAAKKSPAKKTAVKKKAAVKKAAPKKATASKKAATGSKKTSGSKAAQKVIPKVLKEKKLIPDVARPTGMYNGVRLLEDHEIEPFPKKTPYTKKELEKLQQALEDERNNLLRELASLQSTSQQALESARENPGHSLHLAEHATDLQTAETNLAVRSYEVERLALIEEALDRILNNVNHYGLCLASGRKIGIKRLIAQPHAHLCKEMQERYELIRRRRGY